MAWAAAEAQAGGWHPCLLAQELGLESRPRAPRPLELRPPGTPPPTTWCQNETDTQGEARFSFHKVTTGPGDFPVSGG